MKKVAAIIPLVGIFCISLRASEYVYPVGVVEQEEECLVFALYQKSPDHTELWQWNPVTREASRALLSTFTPVGFSLLPDNAGFSFFDNGRLRIKKFLKRSPKALDIYEPIYDLGPFIWVTSDCALFHAKEREKFSLYTLCASDGTVTKVVNHETCDCFYASFIGSSLFYLMRDKDTQDYSLMRCSCTVPSEDSFSTFSGLCLGSPKKVLSCKGSLAFLTMLNEKEGFVIEHQSQIDSHVDSTLSCTCYRVTGDKEDQWSMTTLFSFSLPLSLLLPSSKSHLTESIYPLLPRVVGTNIYFVSFSEGRLHSYCYQEGVGVTGILFDKKVDSLFTDIFPPYGVEDNKEESRLVYGGCLESNDLQLNDLQSNDFYVDNRFENKKDIQEAAEYLFLHTYKKN